MVGGLETQAAAPEGPRVFREVKVPTFRDKSTGWW